MKTKKQSKIKPAETRSASNTTGALPENYQRNIAPKVSTDN